MVHIGRPHTSLPYTGGGSVVLDPDLVDIGELEASPNKFLGTNAAGEWVLGAMTALWQSLLGTGTGADARAGLGLAIGQDVQAFHQNLAKLAAATLGTNRLLYVDANGDLATDNLTAAGRALLDDAAASNQRTTLGLAIGTNVQAYSAILAALAGVTGAANRMPYFSGATAMAMTDLTAFARTILAATDASAVNALLPAGINPQTASYDLVASDAAKIIPVTSATGVAVRVPTDAAQAYPIGGTTLVVPRGAGQITYSAVDGGVTTLAYETGKNKSAAQNTPQALTKLAANSWLLHGALAA